MFKKKSTKKPSVNYEEIYTEMPHNKDTELTSSKIKSLLIRSSDMRFREIYICGDQQRMVTLVFIDGMIDSKTISDDVIKPLMQKSLLCEADSERKIIDLIEHGFVYFPEMKTRNNINDAINDILAGSCALVFDKEKTALTFDTKGYEKRTITEPTSESTVKGTKDSFVESLRVNTATLRSKIKSPNLIIEETIVGKQTRTFVAIAYLDGIVNKTIVDEVKKRLNNIDVDGVIEAGFVEEYIIDNKYSTFPQASVTERTDKFCTAILEGRVGLIIDGLPTVYIIPAAIYQFLRTPDDYSQNFIVVSFIRFLRYVSSALTLFLPAIYVAITTFHPEMIPTELAQAISASKEGVPFPIFIEVLAMLIAFEILLEAGLRMPRNIGQAVSIVGALVVGEASVNAKLISPAVVVIVAATVISGFTIPNQDFSNSIRIWRFIMVLAGGAIGIFGVSMAALFLLYHLASIETFGVPYLSPFAANEGHDFGDSFIRIPLSALKNRPTFLKTPNKRRQK